MTVTGQTQDPDTGLVDRYFDGDTSAFDEIMIRYERQIYRVCYRFVENRDDAIERRRQIANRHAAAGWLAIGLPGYAHSAAERLRDDVIGRRRRHRAGLPET